MVAKAAAPAAMSASEEYELWSLLSQVNDGMLRARDSELRQFGVSAVQVAILYAIKTLGHTPTQSEIARWVVRKPHTVAAALERMERQGLIRQERNAGGRRQVRVEMTEKGEEAFRRQHRQRRVIPAILSSLTREEREILRATLLKLRDSTLLALVPRPLFP